MRVIFLVPIIFLMITRCVYVPVGISPSIEPLRDKNYKTAKSVQGKQTALSLFCIFPLEKPDYNAAIRDALKGEPEGSSLVNVRSYYRSIYLWLFSLHTLIIEGDVVQK